MSDRAFPVAGRRFALPALIVLLLAAAAVTSAPAARAAVPNEFFGVSARDAGGPDYRAIGEGGVGSARLLISWRAIQHGRDEPYRWTRTDKAIRTITNNGIRPVPVLFGSPKFISRNAEKVRPPLGSKEDREAWQRFARAAVDRYGPAGYFWNFYPALRPLAPNDWLVWNEQNARPFWRPEPSAKDYGWLLRITNRAMQGLAIDPNLVTGGMFGFPVDKRSPRAKAFLRKLYKQRGAREAIDGVAVHPYSGRVGGVMKQIKTARKVIRRSGDRGADLWVGEIGWASAGSKRNDLVKNRRGQAKSLSKAYKRLLRKRKQWNIRSALWYTWRDFDGADQKCRWCPKAGLVNERLKAKPAWDAYRRLIRKRS